MRRCLVLLGLTLPFIAVVAQTTPAPDNDKSDVLKLSPFTVSTEKDTGYIAAQVISSGRVGMSVLETPADVTVLTRDFLDDVGATDLNNASIWLPNSYVADPGERDFGNNVTFRGLPSGKFTRNYFTNNYSPEEYLTERLEGSRGPNSILYGDSLLGGQTNVTTKRAKFFDFNTLRLRYTDADTRQAALDVNRRVTSKLAVRVNALYQDGDPNTAWKDRHFDERYYADLAVTYQPWKNGELRIDAEIGYTRKSIRTDTFTDQTSNWNGVTSIDAPMAANAGGISRLTTNTYVYLPSLGANTVMNFLNWGRTTGTGLTLTTDGSRNGIAQFPVLSRAEFAIQPSFQKLGSHYRNFSAYFDQRFDNGIVLELAAESSVVDREGGLGVFTNAFRDVNRFLPNGQANPNFGKMFSQGTANQIQNSPEWGDTIRGALGYEFKTDQLSQLVSLIGSRRHHLFDVTGYQYVRTNGPNTNLTAAENQVLYWRYWDETNDEIAPPTSDGTFQYKYRQVRDTRIFEDLGSVQLNTVGRYFNNRVTAVAGVRWDDFKGNDREAGAFSAVTGDPVTSTLVERAKKFFTKSLGGTYFPIPQVGVYANYSEGFFTALFANPQLVPVTGQPESKGYNFGARFNLLDSRLQGSIGYYHAKEVNRNNPVGPTPQINAIWVAMNQPDRQLFQGTTTTAFYDTVDTEGDGYEADFSANLTKSLRFKANIAFPEASQTNSAPHTKAYVAANLAEWQAAAAAPGASPVIAQNITAIQTVVSNAVDGREFNGTFKWRANVFANYEFRQGSLKGLRLGAGANGFGKRLIGSPAGAPFTYIYQDSYWVGTVTAGFPVKFGRTSIDFQLNVTNVFDYDDPVFTSVSTIGTVTYKQAYNYVTPRTIMLTTTLKF
jgi:outer membrane receptor for ferric coprogen and ferric-rhodotorulic acid